MRGRLQFCAHHTVWRVFIAIVSIISLLAVNARCREELYNPAKTAYERADENNKNGTGSMSYTIAAIVVEGEAVKNTKVLLCDDKMIFRSMQVYEGECNGTVYLDKTGWVFVTKYDNYAYKNYVYAIREGMNIVYDFSTSFQGFANENGFPVLMTSGNKLYRFEASQNPPWQYMRQTGTVNVAIFASSKRDGSYMVEQISGGTYQYRLYDLNGNLIIARDVESGFFPIFYDRVDAQFWLGNSSKLCDNSNTYAYSDGTIFDYAIMDATSIFAIGTHSGSIKLLKYQSDGLGNSSFMPYRVSFNSSLGKAMLDIYDNDKLVIGLASTDQNENGLYIYSITTNEKRHLTPLPVYGISTIRR
ncbi:MAG: hypothetical protein N2316_00765 [Spirochaetes bacterium]|nr:hypothetical protein [Spirochaetota bacterium]